MRSRDAHSSSRSDRLCARPPVLDAEVVGGWGTKSRSRPANRYRQNGVRDPGLGPHPAEHDLDQPYSIMRLDSDQGRAQASEIQY